MAKAKDIFDSDNEVKVPFGKFDKVGRAYKGVYVKKETVPNALRPGTNQVIYTLADAYEKTDETEWTPIEGSILRISGRGNRNPAQLPALEICKFGELVAVKFVEERKTKPGFNPVKIIRVYTKHEMFPDILNQFTGEGLDTSDMEAEETVEKM